MSYLNDLFNYLKPALQKQLLEKNLKQIQEYLSYKPYFIQEFPKNTPLISCYLSHTRHDVMPDIKIYNLEFYIYFERKELPTMEEKLESYAEIIEEVLENWECRPRLLYTNFIDYYAEENQLLFSFTIEFEI